MAVTAIKIESAGEKVRVKSPFSQKFVERARQLGGKWLNEAWVFDAHHEDRVRCLLQEVYGTDGTPGPVATLHINLDGLDPDGNELMVGPVQVLRKLSRDSAPRVGEGCAVIKGKLKSYGGSARYPQLTWESGTVVEVRGIPALLAQRLAEEDPDSFTLVVEAAPDDSLTPQEESLVATIFSLPPERRALVLAKLAS